jgi:hypothetical protein
MLIITIKKQDAIEWYTVERDKILAEIYAEEPDSRTAIMLRKELSDMEDKIRFIGYCVTDTIQMGI